MCLAGEAHNGGAEGEPGHEQRGHAAPFKAKSLCPLDNVLQKGRTYDGIAARPAAEAQFAPEFRLSLSASVPHMPYLLVRHKVADFSKWKPVYDSHLPARQKAGLKEVHLLRNIDDPNEVVLLFEAEDVQKARDFAASSDLQEAMQQAGVVDRPNAYFLE